METSVPITTLVLVTLPSGHKAVYAAQPQHLNHPPRSSNVSLNQHIIDYGEQIAHQHGKRWYRVGGWDELTDPTLISLIEQLTHANDIPNYHTN